MRITKMHGIGNSYVIIEDLERELEPRYPAIAKTISDKNFGVGSDGILVVNNGKTERYRMRVFNPDGSEAEMSGNGIRMFARYLHDRKLIEREAEIEAGGSRGGRIVRVNVNADNSITVGMGRGIMLDTKTIHVSGRRFSGVNVDVGNPHFVVFGRSPGEIKEDAQNYGSALEHHRAFRPARTNVEFAFVRNREEIVLYTWERGAGLTLACGTGACATALAALRKNLTESIVKVKLPGGTLRVEINSGDSILLSGPAEYIFSGEVDLGRLLE
jgi:diaminopimelate epimerase